MAYENLFNGRLVLFTNNEKRSEKSPDMGGTIEFQLKDALAFAEWVTSQPGEDNYAGEKVIKVPVSAWNRESKKGTNFVSGSVSVAKPQDQEQNDLPF